jgi:hypothetical protein
MAKKTSRKEK